VADRSTTAVEVAGEGGGGTSPDPQDSATPDGTTTDGRSGATSAGDGTPPKDTSPAGADAPTEPLAKTPDPDEEAAPAAEESADPDSPAPDEQPDAPAADGAAAPAPASGPEPESDVEGAAAPSGDESPEDKAEQEAEEKAGGNAGQAPEEAAADDAEAAGQPAAAEARKRPRTAAPDLHSGHRLARRYQLAECVTRVDGFSSWRAVDEKLRRAVGVHVLPAGHERARKVLAAARSAALLGDPRFVQVLDAVEEDDLVYVIHEWLPDAVSLADLLSAGPLEPHETYQMVSQVAQGMAAANREGLAHLRLDPGAVLRTSSGQYRIRGLAVAAALRGLSSDRPQRQDTEAIGALLYAALTQRWPYEEDTHGLAGLPKGAGLVAPDQVRAGVHRGLSDLAMRALVNDGATASREEPPCTTPDELAKAVAALPRIRPPEHPAPVYQKPAFQQPPQAPAAASVYPAAQELVQTPPPALPGKAGSVLKWAVSALLIVAIGLGSWQLADALKSRENGSPTPTPTPKAQQHKAPPPVRKLTIAGASSFDPQGDDHSENPKEVPKAYDGDASTYWQTNWYARADLGGLKDGVGLVLDLGSARAISSVTVDMLGDGTDLQLMAAPSGAASQPSDLDGFTPVAKGSGTSKVTLKPGGKVTTRFLLVWLTKLPPTGNPDEPFRGKISEIDVTG
jgi:hypothetical protein